MPNDEKRHADETTQHWRDMPKQCREDAWQLFKSLLAHFYDDPVAWAKVYKIGLPVVNREKTVDAAEVRHAFLQALPDSS